MYVSELHADLARSLMSETQRAAERGRLVREARTASAPSARTGHAWPARRWIAAKRVRVVATASRRRHPAVQTCC